MEIRTDKEIVERGVYHNGKIWIDAKDLIEFLTNVRYSLAWQIRDVIKERILRKSLNIKKPTKGS